MGTATITLRHLTGFGARTKFSLLTLVFCCVISVIGSGGAFAGQPVRVTIDKNYVLRTDRPVHTVVVGNPYIADVSAQSSKLLFVLGKAMGETNLLGFDVDGNVVFDKDVTVIPHLTRTVTVHRGGQSDLAGVETLACAPRCENKLRPGDGKDLFEKLDSQTKSYSDRSKDAVGIVTGSAAGRGG